MKKVILILVCFIFLTGIAIAQETKWYFGAGYGLSDVDTGVSGLTGTATLDEEDSGFKFFGGFQFNKFVGVEIAYVDFGEAELRGNNGDTFVVDGVTYQFTASNASIDAEATAFVIETVLSLPLGDVSGNDFLNYLTPFLKVGVHFWDIEYSISASNLTTTTADDDGTDLVFGAGIDFNLFKNVGLRAEWERFMFDDEIDLFSGSIVTKF